MLQCVDLAHTTMIDRVGLAITVLECMGLLRTIVGNSPALHLSDVKDAAGTISNESLKDKILGLCNQRVVLLKKSSTKQRHRRKKSEKTTTSVPQTTTLCSFVRSCVTFMPNIHNVCILLKTFGLRTCICLPRIDETECAV